MNVPRLVIAGTSSGVGKTTISTAIMAALHRRGFRVQGFKTGPDYIDPGYHRLATGLVSRNLDSWMMGREKITQSFFYNGSKADICIVEGVMGLFDGSLGDGSGSTAEIAGLLQAPIVLVVDTRSMAQSAAAVVYGYQNFWPHLNIAGVILNRVGSDKHRITATRAIEDRCRIPVIGAIHRDARLSTPERHLGLLPVPENKTAKEKIETLGATIEQLLDLDLLVQIAQSAPQMDVPVNTLNIAETRPAVKIAVALDEVFNFYYQDSLDTLTALGANLVFFSPLHDTKIPPGACGLIIGGGFPEMYLKELAANREMRAHIGHAHKHGLPIYAECGGLVYLAERVTGLDGETYPMVGIVPGSCTMETKLVGMGYVTAEALSDNILCSKGYTLKGHEFHYSSFTPAGKSSAYKLYGGRGPDGRLDGHARGNVLASYLHLNFFGDPTLAEGFVNKCREFSGKT